MKVYSFKAIDSTGKMVCSVNHHFVLDLRLLLKEDQTGLVLSKCDLQKVLTITNRIGADHWFKNQVEFLLQKAEGDVKFELEGDLDKELSTRFLMNSFKRIGLDDSEARYQTHPCSGYEPEFISGSKKMESLGYSDTFLDNPSVLGMTEEMMTLIIEGC